MLRSRAVPLRVRQHAAIGRRARCMTVTPQAPTPDPELEPDSPDDPMAPIPAVDPDADPDPDALPDPNADPDPQTAQ
jgi:hypothetical protein